MYRVLRQRLRVFWWRCCRRRTLWNSSVATICMAKILETAFLLELLLSCLMLVVLNFVLNISSPQPLYCLLLEWQINYFVTNTSYKGKYCWRLTPLNKWTLPRLKFSQSAEGWELCFQCICLRKKVFCRLCCGTFIPSSECFVWCLVETNTLKTYRASYSEHFKKLLYWRLYSLSHDPSWHSLPLTTCIIMMSTLDST